MSWNLLGPLFDIVTAAVFSALFENDSRTLCVDGIYQPLKNTHGGPASRGNLITGRQSLSTRRAHCIRSRNSILNVQCNKQVRSAHQHTALGATQLAQSKSWPTFVKLRSRNSILRQPTKCLFLSLMSKLYYIRSFR